MPDGTDKMEGNLADKSPGQFLTDIIETAGFTAVGVGLGGTTFSEGVVNTAVTGAAYSVGHVLVDDKISPKSLMEEGKVAGMMTAVSYAFYSVINQYVVAATTFSGQIIASAVGVAVGMPIALAAYHTIEHAVKNYKSVSNYMYNAVVSPLTTFYGTAKHVVSKYANSAYGALKLVPGVIANAAFVPLVFQLPVAAFLRTAFRIIVGGQSAVAEVKQAEPRMA